MLQWPSFGKGFRIIEIDWHDGYLKNNEIPRERDGGLSGLPFLEVHSRTQWL